MATGVFVEDVLKTIDDIIEWAITIDNKGNLMRPWNIRDFDYKYSDMERECLLVIGEIDHNMEFYSTTITSIATVVGFMFQNHMTNKRYVLYIPEIDKLQLNALLRNGEDILIDVRNIKNKEKSLLDVYAEYSEVNPFGELHATFDVTKLDSKFYKEHQRQVIHQLVLPGAVRGYQIAWHIQGLHMSKFSPEQQALLIKLNRMQNDIENMGGVFSPDSKAYLTEGYIKFVDGNNDTNQESLIACRDAFQRCFEVCRATGIDPMIDKREFADVLKTELDKTT